MLCWNHEGAVAQAKGVQICDDEMEEGALFVEDCSRKKRICRQRSGLGLMQRKLVRQSDCRLKQFDSLVLVAGWPSEPPARKMEQLTCDADVAPSTVIVWLSPKGDHQQGLNELHGAHLFDQGVCH